MDNLEQQLEEVMHSTWQAMLGLDLRTVPLAASWKEDGQRGMMACIQITGGWEGAVTIECTAELARSMAEEMFGMEPGEAADAEILDALGELVNVVGGNVKALLAGGAELSLPAVTSGVDYKVVVPGSTETCQLGFDLNGEPIRLGLLARQA